MSGNMDERANNPSRNECRTQNFETVFCAINELHEATNKQENDMQAQIQVVGGVGGCRQSIPPEEMNAAIVPPPMEEGWGTGGDAG